MADDPDPRQIHVRLGVGLGHDGLWYVLAEIDGEPHAFEQSYATEAEATLAEKVIRNELIENVRAAGGEIDHTKLSGD